MRIPGGLVVFVLFCLASAQNFYDKNAHIMELTPKSFDKVVHRTNYTTMVEFYAPWCGYCQQLKGIMQKAAKSLDGIVQIASVNCDLAKNKRLCAQYRVEGFPTLMVFRPPKVDLKKSADSRIALGNHASEIYKGERKLRPIVDFCTSRVKNYVNRIPRIEKMLEILKNSSQSRMQVILFSKRDKISPLYKSLALDWLGVMDFHVFPNSKLQGLSNALEPLGGKFKELLLGLQQDQAFSDSSLLVAFNAETQDYHIYEDQSFDKKDVWKFLSLLAEPREGPYTKRQEYLDAVRKGLQISREEKGQKKTDQCFTMMSCRAT
ncbi:LADA_0C05204g1_1 [Lachancea dasiensis]|uniref:LADA_0C05204g1_1 n=1 Tax=Lachancea dasiensis TaxID=1072105 RepID=A0A1G4IZ38_9SACH|nr:LADA_0C05204g1_1 [Lachancea dasiensis]